MMHSIFKVALGAVLALSGALSQAKDCSIQDITSDDVRAIIRANGGYPISDAHCDMLNGNKLAIGVTGQSTVLNGVSMGWVVVTLRDPDNGIVSKQLARSTRIDTTSAAGQDVADKLLYAALKGAIETLDWGVAVNDVKQFRRAIGKK